MTLSQSDNANIILMVKNDTVKTAEDFEPNLRDIFSECLRRHSNPRSRSWIINPTMISTCIRIRTRPCASGYRKLYRFSYFQLTAEGQKRGI